VSGKSGENHISIIGSDADMNILEKIAHTREDHAKGIEVLTALFSEDRQAVD